MSQVKRHHGTMKEIHLKQIDLNLLVIFVAVLDERSVKTAARRLGLTSSAVSHALARLRQHLHDPLFVQTRGGMVPSERAQELSTPVRRCLVELGDALTRRPEFDAACARRSFSLATSDYGEWLLVPPLMRALARAAPGVDINVQAIPSDPARALESGAVDLVVCLERHLAPSLHRQQLLTDRFVCVVRTGHPATRGRLTLQRYLGLQHAVVSPQGQRSNFVDAELERRGHARRVVLRLPHFMVAPFIVAETDLVMTLSEQLVHHLRPKLGLRVIAAPIELPSFRYVMGWHERQHDDSAQRWLRAQLGRVAGERSSPLNP
jgi:DNA-binding transcriptional LysR family regulator